MTKEVDYYFDVVSSASYLAWTQLPKLVEETGATINYKPLFLPGLFKATGNSSPITVPPKGKWLFDDLQRWAVHYGVPFNMNDQFPLNSLYMMRGLTAYLDDERFLDLANGFFDAMWVSNKDLTNPEVIGQCVTKAGIDPGEFMEKIGDPALKQQLSDVTKEAQDRGAFGAPTFYVGTTMYWGQDRMEFVKQELLA